MLEKQGEDKYFDIRSFNGASFSNGCTDILAANTCFRYFGYVASVNAAKSCNGIGSLPTEAELVAVCEEELKRNPT